MSMELIMALWFLVCLASDARRDSRPVTILEPICPECRRENSVIHPLGDKCLDCLVWEEQNGQR